MQHSAQPDRAYAVAVDRVELRLPATRPMPIGYESFYFFKFAVHPPNAKTRQPRQSKDSQEAINGTQLSIP